MTGFIKDAASATSELTWGLVATGVSGPWGIDLVESTDADHWRLQLEGPVFSATIPIEGPAIIDQAIQFFRDASAEQLTLLAGKPSEIQLLRDDEFSDRFFLSIRVKDDVVARFTLTQPDLGQLRDALRQLQAELSAS